MGRATKRGVPLRLYEIPWDPKKNEDLLRETELKDRANVRFSSA